MPEESRAWKSLTAPNCGRCMQRGNLTKISGFCGVAKKANAARKYLLLQNNIRFEIPKQEDSYFSSKISPLGL